MTSRERVTRAIRFSGPDRLPILHGILPGAVDRHGKRLEALLERYPSDFAGQSGRYLATEESPHYQQGLDRDEWGCTWINLIGGVEGQVRVHPLADWRHLETYRPPDPRAGHWGNPEVRPEPDRYWLEGGGGGRLFERMHFLRGFQALLCDIAEGRPEVRILRDLVLKHTLERLEEQLIYPMDAISFMDDWGTQDRLMIRPDAWRELFKPAYRQIVDRVHAAGKQFYFHTDGHTREILPDLIEIGVDVLNPQFSCMPLEAIAEICAGQVCISSDIDRQRLLPHGTPREIRAHVRRVVELFGGPRGGLIGRASIGPDVPYENLQAVLSAFAEYGS
jgi:hypothetical protein